MTSPEMTRSDKNKVIKKLIQDIQEQVFVIEAALEMDTDQRCHLYKVRVDLQNYINWWVK